MGLIIDDINDTQKKWLAHLVQSARKSLNSFVPVEIFAVFRARSWVEGDAGSCRLTGYGNGAAMRIFGSDMGQDQTTRKIKRKHSDNGK
jgi:hypothetical protein